MMSIVAANAEAQRPAVIRASATVIRPQLAIGFEPDSSSVHRVPPERRVRVTAASGARVRITPVDSSSVKVTVDYLAN